MEKHILVLPDGAEVSSGAVGDAVMSVRLTQCVNPDTELTAGAVCCQMLEAAVLSPDGLTAQCGQTVTLLREAEDGTRTAVGLFLLEKPQRESTSTYKLVAYDRASLLDTDLTDWLESLDGWPYPLYDLATLAAQQCGLELINDTLPNGSYLVQKFSADGITGRQLMQWVGQAACRFCRATADGALEFAWYEATNVNITPGGEIYYFQGGLTYADYATAPVEKVQIKLNREDVGAVYPDDPAALNTYTISGNYLLTTGSAEALEPVVRTIFETLQAVTYTPCSISMPASGIRAGDIITVTDPGGKTITAYVMTKTRTEQTDELECTGNPCRDSSTAVNQQSYEAVSGKVLELRTDVDGLKVENRDAAGKAAALELTVEGLSATVAHQQSDVTDLREKLTTLEQTAEQVYISVTDIRENGASKVTTATGYTFAEDGLTIQKSGQEMENRLDHTGMYVARSGEVILQANAEGVTATDVQVRNYLNVGDNARFEDYTDGTDSKRTACFYTGG